MTATESLFEALPPGSDEAGENGCICAVMDNGRGRGYLGGVLNPDTGKPMFVVTVGCPLHSPEVVND